VDKALGSTSSTPQAVSLTTQVPTHGDYILPNPGILPGNPLYPLKMIRDRIGLSLTFGSTRKALLLLHFADKRIAAAQKLLSIGQLDKAVETATKAEIYLFQSINVSKDFSLLKKAILKHEEVIEEIQQMTSGSGKDQANHLHHDLDLYRLQIVSLSGQPFGYSRPEDLVKEASQSATPSGIPSEPYL